MDVITAAAVLGDDVDTVLDRYADLQKFNAEATSDRRILRIANVRYEKRIQALGAEMVKLQEEHDYWRNMAEAPAK